MSKKYLVTYPDGTSEVLRGTGPYFIAWRLTRDCAKIWNTPSNRWLASGGRARLSVIRRKIKELRVAQGASADAPHNWTGKPVLMCGRSNVRLIVGVEVQP